MVDHRVTMHSREAVTLSMLNHASTLVSQHTSLLTKVILLAVYCSLARNGPAVSVAATAS